MTKTGKRRPEQVLVALIARLQFQFDLLKYRLFLKKCPGNPVVRSWLPGASGIISSI
jgi:hypothetical protein